MQTQKNCLCGSFMVGLFCLPWLPYDDDGIFLFFPLLVRSFIVPFQSISKVLLHSAALERRRGNKEQKQNSIADVLSILCVVVVLVLHSMLYILE